MVCTQPNEPKVLQALCSSAKGSYSNSPGTTLLHEHLFKCSLKCCSNARLNLLKAKLSWRSAWLAEGPNCDSIFVLTIVQHEALAGLPLGCKHVKISRKPLLAVCQAVQPDLLQVDQANSPFADLDCMVCMCVDCCPETFQCTSV